MSILGIDLPIATRSVGAAAARAAPAKAIAHLNFKINFSICLCILCLSQRVMALSGGSHQLQMGDKLLPDLFFDDWKLCRYSFQPLSGFHALHPGGASNGPVMHTNALPPIFIQLISCITRAGEGAVRVTTVVSTSAIS